MFQTATHRKTPALIMEKYESLESKIYSIYKKSEHTCWTTIAGRSYWSPTLVKAIDTVKYWRGRLKYNRDHPVVIKLGVKLNIDYKQMEKDEIVTKITESKLDLDNIRKKSSEICKQYLEDLAENYAKLHNIQKSRAIQELITQEEIRLMFSTIRKS